MAVAGSFGGGGAPSAGYGGDDVLEMAAAEAAAVAAASRRRNSRGDTSAVPSAFVFSIAPLPPPDGGGDGDGGGGASARGRAGTGGGGSEGTGSDGLGLAASLEVLPSGSAASTSASAAGSGASRLLDYGSSSQLAGSVLAMRPAPPVGHISLELLTIEGVGAAEGEEPPDDDDGEEEGGGYALPGLDGLDGGIGDDVFMSDDHLAAPGRPDDASLLPLLPTHSHFTRRRGQQPERGRERGRARERAPPSSAALLCLAPLLGTSSSDSDDDMGDPGNPAGSTDSEAEYSSGEDGLAALYSPGGTRRRRGGGGDGNAGGGSGSGGGGTRRLRNESAGRASSASSATGAASLMAGLGLSDDNGAPSARRAVSDNTSPRVAAAEAPAPKKLRTTPSSAADRVVATSASPLAVATGPAPRRGGGGGGGGGAPSEGGVVQAGAAIPAGPAGLLLTRDEDGALALAARWRWPTAEVPGICLDAAAIRALERSGAIVELEELRRGRDPKGIGPAVPAWLLGEARAWALAPLLHFDRLVGAVVLARPPHARRLDWEDFDLLRVVGQQLASYLAEHAGQEALAEAGRFDDFHRRIAFVMHDIKNLASQLSLLARNAERHADNPEFRQDMVATLRSSVDKMNDLLARLSQHNKGRVAEPRAIPLGALAEAVAASKRPSHLVKLEIRGDVVVQADPVRLEQALAHLVQNAIDASPADEPVWIRVEQRGIEGVIEIIDHGTGMTAEFMRSRLFKPFASTKEGGFGIGAFEARSLIAAMGGRLDVESREQEGSRFTVTLPLSEGADGPRRPEGRVEGMTA